jgi:serine/threonine protein kinase
MVLFMVVVDLSGIRVSFVINLFSFPLPPQLFINQSYAAPENLRSGSSGCVGYDGLRADVWSCGIVLFVMLYGITPWDVAADTCAEYRAYRVSDGFPNSRPWNRLSTAIRSIFHR